MITVDQTSPRYWNDNVEIRNVKIDRIGTATLVCHSFQTNAVFGKSISVARRQLQYLAMVLATVNQ